MLSITSMRSARRKRARENSEEDPLEQLKSLMGGGDEPDKEKNHIYFYGDVTSQSCLDLNRKINNLNKELLKHAIEYDCTPPNIFLHISSNGGCLLSAMSCVDTIRNSRVPIVSIIEGSAASAATIISMVCHRRYITENSFMLIHQLTTGVYGKYQEIKDDYLNDTKFMERLYRLYEKYTSMPLKKIKHVMSHDIWWDSNECIANGLTDSLWDSNHTSISITNLFSSDFQTGNTKKITPAKKSKK
jgi:ATP-dependent protease ClpP protease subunit